MLKNYILFLLVLIQYFFTYGNNNFVIANESLLSKKRNVSKKHDNLKFKGLEDCEPFVHAIELIINDQLSNDFYGLKKVKKNLLLDTILNEFNQANDVNFNYKLVLFKNSLDKELVQVNSIGPSYCSRKVSNDINYFQSDYSKEVFDFKCEIYKTGLLEFRLEFEEYKHDKQDVFDRQESMLKSKVAYSSIPFARKLTTTRKKTALLSPSSRLFKSDYVDSNEVDNIPSDLDPLRKTDFTHFFIQSNSLILKRDYQNIHNTYFDPKEYWFGLTAQRICFSVQMKMGLMKTDYFEYLVEKKFNGNYNSNPINTGDTVLIKNTSGAFSFSAGFNTPVRRNANKGENKSHIYLLFGIDLKLDFKSEISSTKYELSFINSTHTPIISKRIELGYNWNIPNSRIGFGVNISYSSYSPNSNRNSMNWTYLDLKSSLNNEFTYKATDYCGYTQGIYLVGFKILSFF